MRLVSSRRCILIAISVALTWAATPSVAVRAQAVTTCTAQPQMHAIAALAGQPFPAGGARADGSVPTAPKDAAAKTPDSKLTITNVDVFSTDDSCTTAHNVRVRFRVAALNTSSKADFVTRNALVTCGLYSLLNPSSAPTRAKALKPSNLKLATMAFTFHFPNVRQGEAALSNLPVGIANSATTTFTTEGEADSDRFTAGAHLGGCNEKINGAADGPASTLTCTGETPMRYFKALKDQPFPTTPPSTPTPPPLDSTLTITNVDVFTSDSSCGDAHNIRVRFRVAAQNNSPNTDFVMQNARVICGLFAQGFPGAPAALKTTTFKLSTLNFQFFFLNIRHGEAGLSILSTGVENDPTKAFTIEGEATSSDFIAGAQLGDCMERFNV